MLVISGSSGKELGEQIANALNCPHIRPEFKIYNDGESYLRLPTDLSKDVLVVQSCHAPQDSNLFQLLNLISTVKRLQDAQVTAFVPYLCYARADRDILGGEAISAKTVLELLEAVGTDRLITLDVHNPEIFRFVNQMECVNIYPSKSWASYLRGKLDNVSNLQIIAPDQGAIERAEILAKELGVSHTNLAKTRDPKTGEIDLVIGNADIQSETVVLVDDIMSTGSTLIEAASLLTTEGVHTVHVLISHAIGTSAVDRLREIGGGLVAATNSIPTLIGTISVVDDIVSVLVP